MPPAGRLTVSISKDGMAATCVLLESSPILKEDLLSELAALGVVHGVDDSVCDKIVAMDLDTNELVVARGTPSTPGANGEFIPAFEVGIQPGKVREDGSIDFHERDLLKSVAEGDLLGTVVPPTNGDAGSCVDGKEIPSSHGKPATLAIGPGARLQSDGTLVAARAGVVIHRPNASIDVTDHHVHRGDVDLKSGDLRLEGAVSIRGSVARTFTVRATGDVEVSESVDGGTVHAGGDIRIRGTVRGADAGFVSAVGDVSVRLAESAQLRCGGTLRVAEALNSHLSAKRVEVTRRLRGGVVAAEESVVVQEAGTSDGTLTTLTAGEPLGRSPEEVLVAVGAAKTLRAAQHRHSMKPAISGIDRGKGGKTGRIQAALSATEIQERVALAARREALAAVAFVHIAGEVHSGVVVQIGVARFDVEQDLRAVRFVLNSETRKIEVERAHK